jgi:ABC-type oligopeptide transport system substrate-binding subunit
VKKRDLIYLMMAVTMFLVAGYVGYTQLAPKSNTGNSGEKVYKVGTIPASFDAQAKKVLTDSSKAQDFGGISDYNGLGNKAPFGP